MRRAEKLETIQELESDLRRATVAVLADYRGLTAGQMNRLRKAVREADGRCRVAKNTFARRAVDESRRPSLEPLLRGPLAMILGFRDPVAIAKLAVKFAEEMPKLEIKAAVLGERVLPAAEVKALATLPSREVLLAQFLGLLQAPATQLLRTLNEPGARLARLVDALAKRAGNADEAPAGEPRE
ncbi:MAG: 50S ribosomal protein L10 [Deltaproteobacteria bacterium]|nr:MAG: 50S ribosomal protein L10 [Deltaproteobacteria bacterium]